MTASPASPEDPALPAAVAPEATRAAPRLQVGGSLGEGSIYVERAADRDLFVSLRRGELCYVLATRQIGKSSLRARVAARLRAEGVASVHIDLTALGVRESTPAGWYFGLTSEIADQLGLDDPSAFWDARQALGPVHVFSRYLEEAGRAAGRAVVFIDEIDATLSLPFPRDDFFAALRAHQNHGAESPDAARLSLCLLGVAAPDDLIADPALTPFNIGRAIRLDDFSRAEMEGFGAALPGTAAEAAAVLDEVYGWTSGHPYMTQRVLGDVVDLRRGQSVEEIVRARFVEQGKTGDANLAHVERFLDQRAKREQVPRLLAMYGRILEGEIVGVDGSDPLQLTLRLAGLVGEREEGGARRLVVRNRIFREVYGPGWVRERLAGRPLAEAAERWRAGGRKKADLVRGWRLTEGRRWAAGREDLTGDEQAFLEACARATAAWQQWVIVVLAALVVGLVVVSVVAWKAWKRADLEAERARYASKRVTYQFQIVDAHRLAAMSEALGAAQQPARLLLAVEAVTAAKARSQERMIPFPIEEALIAAVSESIPRRTLEGGAAPLHWAAVSPDFSQVVVVDARGAVRLLRVDAPLQITALPQRRATSAAFSADGSLLVTTGEDADILLSRLDGTTVATFHDADNGRATVAAVDPGGDALAVGYRHGAVKIVKIDRGVGRIDERRTAQFLPSPWISKYLGPVVDINWTPGEDRVTATFGGGAEISRSLSSDAPGASNEGVYSGAPFIRSPNGGHSVSINLPHPDPRFKSRDRPIRFDQAPDVLTARFSPDSTRVCTVESDGVMRIWLVAPLDDLIQRACAEAGRNLTRKEWSRYMLTQAGGTEYHKTCQQWPEAPE